MTFAVRCECVIDVGDTYQYASIDEARAAARARVAQHGCPCYVVRPGAENVPIATIDINEVGEPVELANGFDPRRKTGMPPSTYAIYGALVGEDGAWKRVATGTLVRSLVILPGLVLWNLFLPRGRRFGFLGLWSGSVLASVSCTAMLFAYYAVKLRMERGQNAQGVVS